ncbi:MAG: glutamate--tRNA ligase [Patescibacteria group bacterium]|nr:glutamate--tRNA ligase [Patescibacteria group bacterium]
MSSNTDRPKEDTERATVVTRFAPSPTGLFHAGSYRTALFAYIFARQNGGRFILRIEDTDKERSKKEFEDNIIESLKWLGLEYDEFYRQSERTEIYRESIRKLIDSGHAYVSDESQSVDKLQGRTSSGQARSSVIRFRNPNKKVAFDDLIRGRIEFDTTELGDFVIAKSMEEPVFHLVNVVDDMDMGMTHIIRGEDHISNTPRQILIFEALGAKPPIYAHIPLLLSTDRSKLSKRHGAVSMTEYRERGYIPDALVNFMALLGWHPAPTPGEPEKEIMSLEEIIQTFSLDRVQKSGAIFDDAKLNWFNKQYISKLGDSEFASYASAFLPDWIAATSPQFGRLIQILREKISVLGDIKTALSPGGELAFVHSLPDFHAEMLLWKKDPSKEKARMHLEKVQSLLAAISDDAFTAESIKGAIWDYAEAEGKGDVLWPFRMALTGQERSPDPVMCAFILGREETLKRIDSSLKKLSAA